MQMGEAYSWLALVGMGAFHGINPGMGWLFAVALGMQEKSRGAVYQALVPLALGHALAIGLAVALAAAVGAVAPLGVVRPVLAAILILFGVSRLFRHRHPRWVAIRVGAAGLTAWSFLMATAHGAGLMVTPVFLSMTAMPPEHAHHHAMATATAPSAFLATGAHTAAYLLATAAIAGVVFEKLGLGLLKKAWFNLDRIWAGALIATGAVTLAL